MRHTSLVYRRRQDAQLRQMDRGTVKSVERQRGTGSIAPNRDAQVGLDTGFTSDQVQHADFTTLQVGDRVRFSAVPDPTRPGYATASAVEPDEPAGF